ncbi:hypothetical protein WDW86_04940 [Bdellovibrionota bacterium FG-2]
MSVYQRRAHEAALRDRVGSLAKVVAAMGSAENLKKLVFPRAGTAPDSALLDYHKRLTKLAGAICDADANILRVRFFAKPPQGEILIILDASSSRQTNDGVKIGAPYPDAPMELQQAFGEGKVKTTASLKGGARVSGFAPLMAASAPTGVVVGVEVDATAWQRGAHVARWISKGVTAFFALMLVALFWIVQRSKRGVQPEPPVAAVKEPLTEKFQENVDEQIIAGARFETPEPVSAPEPIEEGLLVISAKGEIVECNPEFVALWSIPQDLLAQKQYAPVLKLITAQMAEPEAFLKQIEFGGSEMSIDDYSKVTLKDGRLLEYRSSLEKSEAGTSWILNFRKC